MATRAHPGGHATAIRPPDSWPLLLGISLLAIPTLISVATLYWSQEAGIHGPIVLATGAWLIARARGRIAALARTGSPVVTAAILLPSLLLYSLARAFDFLSLEVMGLGGALLAAFHSHFGPRAMRHLWFPFLYLAFLIPLPGWLVDMLTGPLKALVSALATDTLRALGFPVVRAGVTLAVAQYQLLVEDACAGMNSLVSLTAISLFYIYIRHNASWRHAAFLTLWIAPVAILANAARIMILVLITYYLGDAAAQGFLHSTAGITMFVVALVGIFLIDASLRHIAAWRRR